MFWKVLKNYSRWEIFISQRYHSILGIWIEIDNYDVTVRYLIKEDLLPRAHVSILFRVLEAPAYLFRKWPWKQTFTSAAPLEGEIFVRFSMQLVNLNFRVTRSTNVNGGRKHFYVRFVDQPHVLITCRLTNYRHNRSTAQKTTSHVKAPRRKPRTVNIKRLFQRSKFLISTLDKEKNPGSCSESRIR